MRMGGHGPPGMGLPRVTEEAGLLRRPAKEEACLPAALPRLCRGLCTSAPMHLLCTPGVQCNLCRLHGKVMSMGVASCLQARTRPPPRPSPPPRPTPCPTAHADARGSPAPPGRPILLTPSSARSPPTPFLPRCCSARTAPATTPPASTASSSAASWPRASSSAGRARSSSASAPRTRPPAAPRGRPRARWGPSSRSRRRRRRNRRRRRRRSSSSSSSRRRSRSRAQLLEMSSEPELFFGRAARDDANVFRSNLVLALEACSRDDRLSKSVRFGSAQNLWLCLCVRVCLTDESLGSVLQYSQTIVAR